MQVLIGRIMLLCAFLFSQWVGLIYCYISPRFKSLINKSLFILIVYSWPLADEVTWPNIWESLQYIIKTKTTLGKARQIQSSLNRGDLRGLWNTRGYCFSLDVKNTYDQPLPLLFVLSFTHELCRSCSIISMGRSFRDCLMFKKYFLITVQLLCRSCSCCSTRATGSATGATSCSP